MGVSRAGKPVAQITRNEDAPGNEGGHRQDRSTGFSEKCDKTRPAMSTHYNMRSRHRRDQLVLQALEVCDITSRSFVVEIVGQAVVLVEKDIGGAQVAVRISYFLSRCEGACDLFDPP